MDFWEVIGSNAITNRADVESVISEIYERLKRLALQDLTDFQDRLEEYLKLLELDELFEIPVEVRGMVWGQTEDHFLYARCACLLAGESSFIAAREDASTFATFVAVGLQSAEMLLYAAETVYESRTGRRLPTRM